MQEEIVKIIVGVPEAQADKIREILGKNGAGKVGNYEYCSFSFKGIGRFRPLEGARPAIGKIGKLEEVPEEQIQTICLKKDLAKIIEAVKEAHPYEEPPIEAWPLIFPE
ncbi:MAG: hypothetical protein WC107_01900 [Patescibacteria group bacterium]